MRRYIFVWAQYINVWQTIVFKRKEQKVCCCLSFGRSQTQWLLMMRSEVSLADTAAFLQSIQQQKREKLPHKTIKWDLNKNKSKRMKYLFIFYLFTRSHVLNTSAELHVEIIQHFFSSLLLIINFLQWSMCGTVYWFFHVQCT